MYLLLLPITLPLEPLKDLLTTTFIGNHVLHRSSAEGIHNLFNILGGQKDSQL